MEILKVKLSGDGYLVNGSMSVPKAEGNRHYAMVKEWLKTNAPEPEFSDVEILSSAKSDKYDEISSKASATIMSGFASSALGASHTYQSDRDDQLNLVGMVVAGSDDYFKCTDANGVAGYKLHTIEQLRQVLSDGKTIKLTILQHADVLKAQADATETVELVNAIEVSF